MFVRLYGEIIYGLKRVDYLMYRGITFTPPTCTSVAHYEIFRAKVGKGGLNKAIHGMKKKSRSRTPKVSEYDQEIPHSHTADQPTAPRGRVTEHS